MSVKVKLNSLIYISIGLALGYYIFRSSPPISKPEVVDEPTSPLRYEKLEVKKAKPLHIYSKKIESKPLQIFKDSEKRKFHIRLNEENISAMEQAWVDLRQQATAQIERDGWRIRLLSRNSIFARAGLQTGDLIRFEGLENSMKESEEQALLGQRIRKILDYIAE